MHTIYNRRNFIKLSILAAAAVSSVGKANSILPKPSSITSGLRVGIIGLDISHSLAFTKLLNDPTATVAFGGYKVVAAYPKGSNDIAFSVDRIPEFTKAVADMAVEIVSSIADLLTKVDVVLLNTNDGRLHLEQVLPVFKAGKPVFIDKPLAASLADVSTIFNLAQQYKVPVFSSSSLRYMENKADLLSAKTGKILGADTFSPATIEKTHPDLFWYGIHGVEMLYTLMGTGCKEVRRIYTPDTDIVTGIWNDNRIGTFRGTRTGPHNYGGMVFGEKAVVPIIPARGFDGLMQEIIRFFQTGVSPVAQAETLEIYAFMQAADESKRQGGAAIGIKQTLQSISANK